MTWFERLSSLDATFLHLENRAAHMPVGAMAIYEGPAPSYNDVLALIESRLDLVPRYLLGRKLSACYPVVPLAGMQTIGIALLSYNGAIGVGHAGRALADEVK